MAPAVAVANRGYHVLVEKPMAVSEDDCRKITKACEDAGVMLVVCHVLRYFPPVVKIKEVIESGMIGKVMTINHTENVGFWHFSHSFVRGNWRREDESTFSLMAKCCHDVDLIYYWMGEQPCSSIQSFGSLQHFKKSNQPQGASDRCLGCPVEQSCPYSAQKVYLSPPAPHWPMTVVCDVDITDHRHWPVWSWGREVDFLGRVGAGLFHRATKTSVSRAFWLVALLEMLETPKRL